MGVGEEDLVGGVVNGQCVGPLQFGGDDGRGVGAIHTDPANVGSVAPVCPVQPTTGDEGRGDDRMNVFRGELVVCHVFSEYLHHRRARREGRT